MNSTKNFKVQIVPMIGNYFSFFRDYIWIGVFWGPKLLHILESYGTWDQGNWEGKFSTRWDFFFHLLPFLSYFGEDTNDFLSWSHHFRKVFNVLSKPIFLLTGSANTSLFSFSPLPTITYLLQGFLWCPVFLWLSPMFSLPAHTESQHLLNLLSPDIFNTPGNAVHPKYWKS